MGTVVNFEEFKRYKEEKEKDVKVTELLNFLDNVSMFFDNDIDYANVSAIVNILEEYRFDVGDDLFFCLAINAFGEIDEVDDTNQMHANSITLEFLSNTPYRAGEQQVIYRLNWIAKSNVTKMAKGIVDEPIMILADYLKDLDILDGALIIPLFKYLSFICNHNSYYFDSYTINSEMVTFNIEFPLGNYNLFIEFFTMATLDDEQWLMAQEDLDE